MAVSVRRGRRLVADGERGSHEPEPRGTEMRVVEIAEPGGPEVLRPAVRRVPQPAAGGWPIRVRAAGVNRPDVQQRAGASPRRPGPRTCRDWRPPARSPPSGQGGSTWRVGEAVCALLPGGGYAEYALTHQDHALPVPRGPRHDRGGGGVGDLLHRLEQRLRARAPRGRRDLPRARRLVGHRHDGDPARPRPRRPRLRHRRLGGQVRAPAAPSAPSSPSTTARRTSSRRSRRRPAGAGSTWSSTWSAATISPASSGVGARRPAGDDRPPERGQG